MFDSRKKLETAIVKCTDIRSAPGNHTRAWVGEIRWWSVAEAVHIFIVWCIVGCVHAVDRTPKNTCFESKD